VVIPYYERSRELNRTLAGLAEQTYPSHLLQVIVVDDGSPTDPPQPPSHLPFELEVLVQEDRGYGLARARNLGAKAAEGDAVIFLDCDMIPERQHLEAHARWHETSSLVVTVGFRFHADFDHVGSDEVSAAVRDGNVSTLVADVGPDRPEWIEAHVARTDQLLGPYDDLYLMMSGGNLGVDRSLYWAAGGTNEAFERWGGEDNELAYRLWQLGAVFVPERMALAWHQGDGQEPTEEERRAVWLQQAKMRDLIPDRSMRSRLRGRTYAVPYLTVHIDPSGQPVEVIGATVDSILASSLTDLVVAVGPTEAPVDTTWLGDTYASDPRVLLEMSVSDVEGRFPFSPTRLRLPAGIGFDAHTLEGLVDQLGASGYGAIHVTLPRSTSGVTLAELTLTRAVNRALALDPQQVSELVGSLFGERWISGPDSGLWLIDNSVEAYQKLQAGLKPADHDLEAQLETLNNELKGLRGRRALRLANAFGTLKGSSSWADLRTGTAALAEAFRTNQRDED
jgi:glycosyltransferase involved in cell wall biosynthesis